MIKVYKEEYVCDITSWSNEVNIYKNPTSGELNDIYKDGDTLKLLCYKKDVYVAAAINILHQKMADGLKYITGLNLMDYLQLYYDSERNKLYSGFSYDNRHLPEKDFNKLIRIIPILFNLGIINNKTIVSGFGEYTEDKNTQSYSINVLTMMDNYKQSRIKVNSKVEEKVLFEEPVAVIPDEDLEYKQDKNIDHYWIYKNPTADEIEELFKNDFEIRILLLGNNYYVASGYHYIHMTMAETLSSYTKVGRKDYDGYFVVEKTSSVYDIFTGEKSINNEIKAYNKLKSFIPRMIECGLLKENTRVFTMKEDLEKYNIETIEDLMNTEL